MHDDGEVLALPTLAERFRIGEIRFDEFLRSVGAASELATVEMVPPSGQPGTRPRIDEPYLSPSQIRTYRSCSAKYMFHYVNGLKEQATSSQVYGNAIHASAEAYFKALLGGMDSLRDAAALRDLANAAAVEYLRQALRDGPLRYDSRWWQGPADTPASLRQDLVRGVSLMISESWSRIVPQATEQGYLIRWADGGLPLLAYLDVVGELRPPDSAGRGTWMIDFKTGAKKELLDAQNDWGLTAYCLGYELRYGLRPHGAALHTLVRAREPYVSIIESSRGLDAYRRLRRICKITEEQIRDGYYSPADDRTCRTCDFTKACDERFNSRGGPGDF